MSEANRIAEAAVQYGSAIIDLQKPLILEREGQPLAVILLFEEYQRLHAVRVDEVQRQQKAWLELEKLLARVHGRPTEYTPEQIEAEITVARSEVRETRRAQRSG